MGLLKEKRIERGLTQKELAKGLGVSMQTLVNWESQHSKPSRKSIKMLSEYFDVPARVFIDEFYGTNKASTWEEKEPTEDKEEPAAKELTITREDYKRAAKSSISKLLNIVGDNKSVMLAAAMLKAEIECRLWP